MTIERFEFQPFKATSEKPSHIGVNVLSEGGRTTVNLFVLDDNEGDLVADNLLPIMQQVADQVLLGAYPEDLHWSLTNGYYSGTLQFSMTQDGRPYRLDVGNMWSLRQEDRNAWSIDGYEDHYVCWHPTPTKRVLERVLEMPPKPKTVFVTPCPEAKSGLFYSNPGLSLDTTQDNMSFVIADTQTVIREIDKADPEMMNHAAYKFRGETPEGWLASNSIEHPYNTGIFVVYDESKEYDGTPKEQTTLAGVAKAVMSAVGAPAKELGPELKFNAGNAGMFVLFGKLG